MHHMFVSAVLSLTLLAPGGAAAQSTDLVALVKAYEAAANSHDWNRVVPFLASNAVVALGDGLDLAGPERIRALHEWEGALGTEIHFTDCVADGQTVTCRAVERNDFARTAGLEAVEYSASSITFEDGRIVRMNATLSDASASAVTRYMQTFLAWVGETDPRGSSRFLNPDGSFTFGCNAASAFKRLLRVYALTRKGTPRAL